MAEEKQNKNDMPDAGLATETRPVPSQAEGADADETQVAGTRPMPSQAEGDEETVEECLRGKEEQPGRRAA